MGADVVGLVVGNLLTRGCVRNPVTNPKRDAAFGAVEAGNGKEEAGLFTKGQVLERKKEER